MLFLQGGVGIMGKRAWLREYEKTMSKMKSTNRRKKSKSLTSDRQQQSQKIGKNDMAKARQMGVALDSKTTLFFKAVCCKCRKSVTICGQDSVRRAKRIGSKWQCQECHVAVKEHAKQAGLKRETEYRPVIMKAYGNPKVFRFNLKSLALVDAVYFLCFMRTMVEYCMDKDGLQLDAVGQSLAPTRSLGLEILIHLHKNHLISVHPNSPIEAFSGLQAEVLRYDKVFWFIPGYQEMGKLVELITELESVISSLGRTPEWCNSVQELWKKVALAECLEYFALYLRFYEVSFFPGEKAREIIRGLLLTHSISTVSIFIWEAVRDTAFYAKKRKDIPKDRAYGTVVSSIEYYANKAQIQSITMLPRQRDYRCPQTAISKVLFDTTIGIGEYGFNCPLDRMQLF